MQLIEPKIMDAEYKVKMRAYYNRHWKNFDMMKKHIHFGLEMMYVLKGKCSIEICNRTLNLSKNQLILLNSEIPHRLIVDHIEGCKILNFEFKLIKGKMKGISFRQLCINSDELKGLYETNKPYITIKDDLGIGQTLKELINEYDNNREEDSVYKDILHISLLTKIALKYKTSKDTKNGVGQGYVRAMIEYIHNHYDVDIKIKDIAKSVSVHENYAQKLFKNSLGVTMIEYLCNFRMEKAALLLENTDIPISEISEIVGINSRQYFSYLFKKRFGKSPSQYRKLIEKVSEDNRISYISET